MTEPTHEVNIAQVLQILGAKEVEIQVQRALIAQLQAELAQRDAPRKNIVPMKEPA